MTTEQIWDIVYQVAVIVISLLAGGASVELVRWLKGLFNTNSNQTLVVVGVVAVVLTIATMIVEYALVPGSVTVANFGTVFITIFTASQVRYRMLKDELDKLAVAEE